MSDETETYQERSFRIDLGIREDIIKAAMLARERHQQLHKDCIVLLEPGCIQCRDEAYRAGQITFTDTELTGDCWYHMAMTLVDPHEDDPDMEVETEV